MWALEATGETGETAVSVSGPLCKQEKKVFLMEILIMTLSWQEIIIINCPRLCC